MTTTLPTTEHASPRPASRVRRALSTPLVRHGAIAVLGLLVVALLVETSPEFRQSQIGNMAYYGIAAGGLTVLIGLSGQLSLGHGAFMAIGAYTAALLLSEGSPTLWTVLAAVVLASAVALAVGVVVGIAAARLHGPYIAGATLALAVAVPSLALQFRVLGGDQGLRVTLPDMTEGMPSWLLDAFWFVTGVELDRYRFLAYLGWILLALTFVALANLSRSRVGRQWRAVRDDDVAAELAGIDLARTRVVCFSLSATTAGVAGALMAMNVRLAAPTNFHITLSLLLLAAVVLGGLGSLTGALLGSAVLVFLQYYAEEVGANFDIAPERLAELSPVILGATVVVVILAAPAGIVGTLRNRWFARRARAEIAAMSTTSQESHQ
ncbi:branched-chain amino acid ABC transporter permease [Rhodococcus sp. HNM0569]|uniref:branched-chain amino acid ABC transporter permease n=1 Tax=Rhodococcus sp. HNM0569 TaxID=2716340 RepID=UPI00146E7A9A|nr:branched-chain amino acid ABC transporter permease [Rhodococcus sp. HNM0569]NLU84375.1 branched-chain amino acid ABC transporter permease [Rhodococcus sp. HNM0569]